jgi:hypothetical protein
LWYRVFAASDAPIEPAALLEHLVGMGWPVRGDFRGDEEGWFAVTLELDGAIVAEVQRYLVSEEGIRAELNTWAAWIEQAAEGTSQQGRLMQQVISTQQLFTIQAAPSADPPIEPLCRATCKYLLSQAGGVYQIDGQGFFAPDGKLLLAD